MRFWFAGITIQEQPKGYLDTFASKPSVLVEPGNVIYGLQGADWSGYVVAGMCRIAEDDGEVNDPSTLLG